MANDLDSEKEPNSKNLFYKIYCSIIDSLCDELETRFNFSNVDKIAASYSIITTNEKLDFTMIKSRLGPYIDLVDQEKLVAELELWFQFKKSQNFIFDEIPKEQKLIRIVEFFLRPNVSGIFPNIFDLFRIYLTVPISNANSERSFSVLKRLKDYLRNTMTQKRLGDICLINIEPEEADNVDLEKIIDCFALEKNRRLKFF